MNERDEKLNIVTESIIDFFNDFEVTMSERVAIMEVIKVKMINELLDHQNK